MVDIRRNGVDVTAELPTQMTGLVAFRQVEEGIYVPVLIESLGGSLNVNPAPGSGGYIYTRNKNNVTTKQKYALPVNQEISDILVNVSPNASPFADNVTLLVALDAPDDETADIIFDTGAVPESLVNDVLFFKLEVRPGGKLSRIPVNGNLLNGNVYVRASDAATGLDVWLGAQRVE